MVQVRVGEYENGAGAVGASRLRCAPMVRGWGRCRVRGPGWCACASEDDVALTRCPAAVGMLAAVGNRR